MLARGLPCRRCERALYTAQVATQRHSRVHRDGLLLDVFKALRVGELMTQGRPYVSFAPDTPVSEVVSRNRGRESTWQDTYPVLDPDGKMIGIVVSSVASILLADGKDAPWALAADMMQPPISIGPEDDVRRATELLFGQRTPRATGYRPRATIVGFLDKSGNRQHVSESGPSRRKPRRDTPLWNRHLRERSLEQRFCRRRRPQCGQSSPARPPEPPPQNHPQICRFDHFASSRAALDFQCTENYHQVLSRTYFSVAFDSVHAGAWL